MSRPKRDVEKWRDAVLKHPDLSDACRVLLLVLADYMGADLKVSVDRAHLARKLNRSERALGRRFREAIGEQPETDPEKARRNLENRLLDRVVRGQKNAKRSVYQGLMPSAVNRTHGVPEDNQFQPDTSKPVENDHKCPVENHGNRVPTPSRDSLPDTRGSCLLSDQPFAGSYGRRAS